MAARAYRPYKRSTAKPTAAKRKPILRTAPPSGELVNAVIQYADLIKDMGGGRSMLCLSDRRRADPVICEPLGREAPRLADVAVIWDDEQDQIVRVLDAARGEATRGGAACGDAGVSEAGMKPFGEERVELTADALAYLAASQGRLH